MKFIIKSWGEGVGIYFTKEQRELYYLGEGDIVDIPEEVFKEVREIKEGTIESKYGEDWENLNMDEEK